MVDLDMIILSSLAAFPAHGYQLKQNIEASYGRRYVNLSNSSLYPRLIKLESDGYIEGKKERQEKIPDRIVYRITPAGIDRLKALAATPIGPRETDFDFMVHAVLFCMLTREERLKVTEPVYADKQKELEEAKEKLLKFGQYLDRFQLAVLESGIRELETGVELYKKLMEME